MQQQRRQRQQQQRNRQQQQRQHSSASAWQGAGTAAAAAAATAQRDPTHKPSSCSPAPTHSASPCAPFPRGPAPPLPTTALTWRCPALSLPRRCPQATETLTAWQLTAASSWITSRTATTATWSRCAAAQHAQQGQLSVHGMPVSWVALSTAAATACGRHAPQLAAQRMAA